MLMQATIILVRLTDYNDDLMYYCLAFSTYFIIASLYVLTSHVAVCACHAELKGYLLKVSHDSVPDGRGR